MLNYRGKKIYSTTAPSSGAIVLSTLKIFEGFDGSASPSDPGIDLTTHYRETMQSIRALTVSG